MAIEKLEYLNPGGSIKDRSAKYMVEWAEQQGLLKPGMTANVKIVTKQSVDKLIIPNTSLRFKPKEEMEQKTSTMSLVQPPMPQGKSTTKDLVKKEFNPIWILENNKPKSIMVKVLETDGKSTTIESNELKAEDEVIISQRSGDAK